VSKPPTTPKALKDATKGLLFPSETDAPVEAFAWPAGPVDAAGVLAAAGVSGKPPVEERTLAEFFRAVPTALRGHYFDLLLALAQHLSGTRVFKVGGPRFQVFVVGTTADGHRAGVKTEVVET
jgi:hypothetical protein